MQLHEPVGLPPDPSISAHATTQRRLTAGATMVIGATLLAATLRVRPGSTSFFILGFAAAATWIAGAVISGPIPIRPPPPGNPSSPQGGHSPGGRNAALPALALGVIAFLGFLCADLVGRHLPVLSVALRSVLAKADTGPLVLVVAVALLNGLGEEYFFRGALFAALESHRPVVTTTLVYVVVTAATGNIALVVAAGVMGVVFSLQRAHTGSIFSPVITHLTWSALMILALPR